jgi:acetylglutamate kinase
VKQRITVVKIGGSTLGSAEATLRDIAELSKAGEHLAVVHGGGEEISRRLEETGIKAEFVDGLRATNEQAMPLVADALDDVNAAIVDTLRSASAIPSPFGAQSGLLTARRIPALGRVGEVIEVDAGSLRRSFDQNAIPVVAPVALDSEDGGLLNINGDTAAGEIATAVEAARLIFCTNVAGVRSRDGELLPVLHIDDAAVLVADGTASGGMAPKLRASMKAAGAGIECAIVDGRRAGSLRRLLEGGGAEGTRIGARART